MKFIKKLFHDKLVDMAVYYFLKILSSTANRKRIINEVRTKGNTVRMDNDQFNMLMKSMFDTLTMIVIEHVKKKK
jgi:hypothetical protein